MKVKIALILSLASMMGIQKGLGLPYQLYCPPGGSMAIKKVGNQYEYSAQMEAWPGFEGRNIAMKSLYDKKLDLHSFSLVAASSSSDNRLFCTYGNPNGEGAALNLVGFLQKGSSCTVIYPEGHKHPDSSYFECKDENELSKPEGNA